MHVTDHQIAGTTGTLFARRWQTEETQAARPAILLFHDSLGCVDLWRDFPAALAARTGLPVIAYDRLGFGRSAPNPQRLTTDFIRQEAHDAVPALRARLAITRFIALGHSVGGAMAVATASAFPEDCAAVITLAAQAFVEDRTLAGIAEAKTLFADPAQSARLARYHGDKAAWVLDAWTETWLDPAFAGWTLDGLLRLVRCPLLALHGDRDEYGSQAHPDRIQALAGSPARREILADCGHVPHREKPDQVLDLLAGFLATETPDINPAPPAAAG